MPAKLPEPTTKVSWRIRDVDLDWLEIRYGRGEVNRVIRELVERFCERDRAKAFSDRN